MNRQEPAFDGLSPLLESWQSTRVGGREFIEAIVAPQHAIGPPLNGVLSAWPGAWYWRDRARRRLVLIRPLRADPAPRWWLHLLLMGVTVLSALGAGAALAGAWYPWSGSGLLGVLQGAAGFFVGLAQGDWRYVVEGWRFALPLLGVLLVHELGHYLAARRHAIQVSPPYFLPIPPTLSPIGTLGAYISLRSPVLDRRQLLDIGASGPLAGMVAVLGVLVWGFLTSERVAVPPGGPAALIEFAGRPIHLGESILTHWMAVWLVPGPGAIRLSLPAFAGWVGAFITTLNLLPLSQLDGGHVLYGLLGRRQAQVGFLVLIVLLYLAQDSWSWYIWVAMAILIGRGGWSHPAVLAPVHPVPAGRRWIGWLAMLVLVLTFVPVPFPG